MNRAFAALLLGISLAPSTALADAGYQSLHQFDGFGGGCNPTAGLTAGSHGEFYGVTADCGKYNLGFGTVFMVTPPAAGASRWGFTPLLKFHGSQGADPDGRLLLGRDGALYGTTYTGGTDPVLFGSIFRLAPPAGGGSTWSFTRLWNFSVKNVGRKGGNPVSQLIQDDTGALYGTTTIAGQDKQGEGQGTVFKLEPPVSAGPGHWFFRRLAYFGSKTRDGASPGGALYRDSHGVLYGTASFGGTGDDGTIFTVTPPAHGKTAWVKRDIVQFAAPESTPVSGLVAGPDGDLYGSTSGIQAQTAGTIFRLVPPKSAGADWKEEMIHQFNGADGALPMGALTPDGKGGLYGSTFLGGSQNNGTLFHLQPQTGGRTWQLTKLYDFGTATPGENIQPNGDLVLDSAGALLGTTFQDYQYFDGSVFRFTP